MHKSSLDIQHMHASIQQEFLQNYVPVQWIPAMYMYAGCFEILCQMANMFNII